MINQSENLKNFLFNNFMNSKLDSKKVKGFKINSLTASYTFSPVKAKKSFNKNDSNSKINIKPGNIGNSVNVDFNTPKNFKKNYNFSEKNSPSKISKSSSRLIYINNANNFNNNSNLQSHSKNEFIKKDKPNNSNISNSAFYSNDNNFLNSKNNFNNSATNLFKSIKQYPERFKYELTKRVNELPQTNENFKSNNIQEKKNNFYLKKMEARNKIDMPSTTVRTVNLYSPLHKFDEDFKMNVDSSRELNIITQSINLNTNKSSNNSNYHNNSYLKILNLNFKKFENSKFGARSNGYVVGYGANTNQGLIRNYNEDRVSIIVNVLKPNSRINEDWPKVSFFGIYDGHGGNKCADFLKENLHQYVKFI
jgi:hypothetical protein